MEDKIKTLLEKIPVSTDNLITAFQLLLCIAALFFSAKHQISSNIKLTSQQRRYDDKFAKKLMKQNYRLEKQIYKNKIRTEKSKLRISQLNQKVKCKKLKSKLKYI
ncbi:MAG: hypothetical protein MSG78_11720 [Clostridiales bacterium]|nr:hypothetical protein [Clostridiales bacterium]